jgi:DNA primase
MHERFLGRLSIPFITPTGVVYMRFRCIEDHNCDEIEWHGKYEGVTGDETRLYNVPALHSAVGVVGICEGELDALVGTCAGLACVGVPGASSFKPFWYRLFEDFDRVLILGDGDPAGRKFVSELAPNIAGAVPRPMPAGHDVTSYIVEHGPEDFLKYVLG